MWSSRFIILIFIQSNCRNKIIRPFLNQPPPPPPKICLHTGKYMQRFHLTILIFSQAFYTVLIRFVRYETRIYNTFLIQYGTFLYDMISFSYDTFIALNNTILTRYDTFFARYDTFLIRNESRTLLIRFLGVVVRSRVCIIIWMVFL